MDGEGRKQAFPAGLFVLLVPRLSQNMALADNRGGAQVIILGKQVIKDLNLLSEAQEKIIGLDARVERLRDALEWIVSYGEKDTFIVAKDALKADDEGVLR